MAFSDRLKHAWNAFMNKDPTTYNYNYYSSGITSYRGDRILRSIGSDRTILTSIMNRIANDVAKVDIKHVYKDDQGRYERDADKGNCI